MLAYFSVPKSLHEKMVPLKEHEQHDLLNIVVWLLQWGALSRLHHFVIMLPHSVCNPQVEHTEDQFDEVADACWLFEARSSYVKQHYVAKGEGALEWQLLAKLWRYFDGKHSFDQIMWRENVKREHIYTLIRSHREVLFPILHE